MKSNELTKLANIEEEHWWFKERREILRLWAQEIPRKSKMLDIGAGVGRQSLLLRDEFDMKVTAVEFSEFGVEACRKLKIEVLQVNATQLPIPSNSFDAGIAMDVLEHIENDSAVLSEMGRVLKPQGLMLITVPAFPFMWSNHDTAVDHVRRYTKTEIVKKIRLAGFTIVSVRYWNSLLFPVAFISRLLFRDGADLKLPSPIINSLLSWIVSKERVNNFFSLLPGTSLMVYAIKRPGDHD
jgi:SAM-dependent methyltransferase